MKTDDSYFQYIQERLSSLPGITYKKMFGGMGLYKNGVVFGMIIDGELYFKVDETNQEEFHSHGSKPFVYSGKNGKPVTLPYWTLPEEILENEEELSEWVNRSYEISLKKKK